MLSTAIILPGEEERFLFNSLRAIKGVEWDGIFFSGKRQHPSFDRSLIFSSPEIIPLICDLLIIADPQFCTFDYLSFAIRNGCHLFLTDKLKITTEEGKQLVHLATEGGTSIQIQNDFLLHPFQKKIRNQISQTVFIEASQSAPSGHDQMYELIFNNLLLILKAAGSQVHKFDVFSGTIPSHEPDLINIHISFKNGSVATLTLRFIEQQKWHFLSIHAGGKVETFDFANNKINNVPEKKLIRSLIEHSANPFIEQICDFIRNITEKKNPGFSLEDEIMVSLLMGKIRNKIEIISQIPSIHQ